MDRRNFLKALPAVGIFGLPAGSGGKRRITVTMEFEVDHAGPVDEAEVLEAIRKPWRHRSETRKPARLVRGSAKIVEV